MLQQLFRRKSVERILRESEREKMEAEHGGSLKRTLRAVDLTAFGIAAIIGAGIFGTVGQAAFDGGPAVSLLFVFIAVACAFTAFCYFKKDAWDSFYSMEPQANEDGRMEAGWALFQHKIPMILFILVATALAVLTFVKRLSLIPVLG